MSWLEWATAGDKLVGLLIGLMGLLAAAARLFWGRVSSRVSEGVSGLAAGHSDIARRLSDVETDLNEMRGDMGRLRTRVGTIEARLDTLATSKEVSELSVAIARQTGV
ncbi:hypothetical protein, partial [Profundibacterium mesophilum]